LTHTTTDRRGPTVSFAKLTSPGVAASFLPAIGPIGHCGRTNPRRNKIYAGERGNRGAGVRICGGRWQNEAAGAGWERSCAGRRKQVEVEVGWELSGDFRGGLAVFAGESISGVVSGIDYSLRFII
jgi:hypothetical protein